MDALRAAAPGTTFAVERTTGINYEPAYPPFFQDPGATVATAEKLLHEELDDSATPVLKLLAHHAELAPDEFLFLARSVAGVYASITRSSPTALLEISGLGVSKASTLALCCAERGISPPRWSPSVTCRTTWKCSAGQVPRTPWATPIRT